MASAVREGSANYGFQMDPKPEWIHLGTHITHVPDAEYPWSASDVRDIRNHYDEGFFPIFRRMAWRSAAGAVVVFKHHGHAWRDPRTPDLDPLVYNAVFPSTGFGADWGFKYGHCNKVFWYELAPARRPRWCQKNGLPGPMVPWGQWIVRMTEETQRAARNAVVKFLELQEEEEKGRMAVARSEQEEASYRQKQQKNYQSRLIDSLGVDDYRAMAAPPSYRSNERRPFVHVTQKG
jgi:hypothetical protein